MRRGGFSGTGKDQNGEKDVGQIQRRTTDRLKFLDKPGFLLLKKANRYKDKFPSHRLVKIQSSIQDSSGGGGHYRDRENEHEDQDEIEYRSKGFDQTLAQLLAVVRGPEACDFIRQCGKHGKDQEDDQHGKSTLRHKSIRVLHDLASRGVPLPTITDCARDNGW